MEPIEITQAEVDEIDLIISSIEALDEHVQMQIKDRGELVKQRKDWWEKIRATYSLVIMDGITHLNRDKRTIQGTRSDKGVDKAGTK